MKSSAMILLPVLAFVAGTAIAGPSTTTLSVPNTGPAYSDMVTLASTTKDSSGVAASTGTVSFYEDSGILLQTVNLSAGDAQWKQKFLAGQHTVYAVFGGNATLATSTSAAVALNISSALAVPSNGAYLGIRANPASAPSQEAAIELREGPAPNGIGRGFALHTLYCGWKDIAAQLNAAGVYQPNSDFSGDIKHGRVPVVSWGCDATGTNSDSVIAAGDPNEDVIITNTAKALGQFPGPVLLRFLWEFNDLGNNQNCRGDSGTPTAQTYSDFIAVWQRIWRLFQSAGATNVLFLWNPGYYDKSGSSHANPHPFYPGNTFVDWIGLDSYQRSLTATFQSDVQPFYGDFSQAQYGKPLMIGEYGSPNWIQNSQELQWTYLQGMLSDFKSNLYPQLKAYDYFDSVGPAGSWVLDDNNGQGNGGLAAFNILGASPLFAPMPAQVPQGVQISPGGIANAASFSTSALAPGAIVSIFGNQLGSATASATTLPLPQSIGGTSVTVNGQAAPLFFVSPSQINLQIPYETTVGTANFVVTFGANSSPAATTAIQSAGAGLFTLGNNQAAVVNLLDGTVNSTSHPAKAGSNISVYLTGQGALNPAVSTGTAAESSPLSIPTAAISAKVGGKSMTVLGSAMAPGYVGLLQVNLVAPNFKAGAYQMTITIGSSVSNSATVNID